MKKKILIMLIIVLALSVFTGCQKAENEGNKIPSLEDETKDKEESNEENDLNGDLSAIVEKIYGIKDSGLNVATNLVDFSNMDSVKYNMGLEDVSKVKEAIVSETMIGSQAYSLVLARVNDAADAELVANEMLKGIDPRKWICVEADDLQIVTHDDLIMLIMVSSAFEDTVTSQQIVDAFKEVCGDEFDTILKK